jgi:hypothetical protein
MKTRNYLLIALMTGGSCHLFAQGWQSLAPSTIYPVNATLSTTPVSIGIGTNAPSAQFHTTGTIRMEGIPGSILNTRILTVDNLGNVSWRNAGTWTGGGTGSFWSLTGNAPSGTDFLGTTNLQDLRIFTNNTQKAVITTLGDLGLGIANPLHRLSITGNEPTGDRRFFINLRNDASTSTSAVGIRLSAGSPSSFSLLSHTSPTYTGISGFPSMDMTVLSTNGAGGIAIASGSANGKIIFAAGAGGSFVERMRITETGNVGIGVTAPAALLHTLGTLRFEGLTSNATFDQFLVTDVNGNVAWRPLSSIPTGASWNVNGNLATAAHFLGTVNSESLRFRTAGTERMVLDTDGNLRIGSASNPTSSRLYIETTAEDADRNLIHLHNNSTTSLSSSGIRMSSGTFSTFGSLAHTGDNYSGIGGFTSADMTILSSNGDGGIAIASGSADGDIVFATNVSNGSYAERMRLDQDGVLRIATSTNHTSHPAVPLVIKGHIAPDGDNLYTCGTSSRRWKEIWAANGTIQTSDERLKTNVKTLDYGLKEVMKLKPVSFNWKGSQEMANPKLGFLAQDIREVIKEVVVKGEDDSYGVYYSDLIPVLVNSIQEQQAIIEKFKSELALVNAELKAIRLTSPASADNNMGGITGKAILFQNVPNPFSETTRINFELSREVNEAFLLIFDMQGTQLRKVSIHERGRTSVTIAGGEMDAGMYLYTLIADGKEVDTKRMILTK